MQILIYPSSELPVSLKLPKKNKTKPYKNVDKPRINVYYMHKISFTFCFLHITAGRFLFLYVLISLIYKKCKRLLTLAILSAKVIASFYERSDSFEQEILSSKIIFLFLLRLCLLF